MADEVQMAHYWYRPGDLPFYAYHDGMNDCQKVVEHLEKQFKTRVTRYPHSTEPAVWGIFFAEFCLHGKPDVETFKFDRVFAGDRADPDPNGFFFSAYVATDEAHDVMVRAALIAFKHHLGDNLLVQSEGAATDERWSAARAACQFVLGYGADFKPEG